jgi:hypothetical protein
MIVKTSVQQQWNIIQPQSTMKLELDSGRVFGEPYFSVHPVLVEYFRPDNETWRSMVRWCVEQFGKTPDDGVWTAGQRWYVNNAKFWFLYEQDQLLFVLRWQ